MRSDVYLNMNEISCLARPSNLSKRQVLEVERMIQHFHPLIKIRAQFIKSRGENDKTTSLRGLERTNFFTDTIDSALLKGQARMAIHSAKDLPATLEPGLVIAAITPCLDERDSLVLRPGIDPSQILPKNLRIATSSTRREEAVHKVAQNVSFSDLRGTIEERLALIDQGLVDGVVVAEAALLRLNLGHLPRVYLPGPTTPGQGSLAIVVREDEKQLLDLFAILDTRQGRPKCYYLGIDSSFYRSPFPLHHCPIIQTKSLLEGSSQLAQSMLQEYLKASHILLTSPRASDYLWQYIKANPLALENAKDKTWICIGPSTSAALGHQAHKRQICQEGASAEDLVPWIEKLQGHYVFYPHSLQARPILKNTLVQFHIAHSSMAIYDTHPRNLDDVRSRLLDADELIFTSPSCVSSLYSQIQPSSRTKLTPIGRVTELALQKYQSASYTATTPL